MQVSGAPAIKRDKKPLRRNKWNAVPKTVDGIKFASTKEADRYEVLKLLEKSGAIKDLSLQPSFVLKANDVAICEYVADFRYKENGNEIIEDVKGVKTPIYKLKKKFMKATHGIEIKET